MHPTPNETVAQPAAPPPAQSPGDSPGSAGFSMPQSLGTRRRRARWGREYTPDEVNRVLRDYDSGMNADLIREKHGVSKTTLYRWIARYESQRSVDHDPGSMRLRIATLEKVVLHLSLENAALRADRDDGPLDPANPSPQEAVDVAS